MIARRGFLGAILAAGVAPAFVGARVLMPVRKLIVPSDPASYHGSFVFRPDDPALPYMPGSMWFDTTGERLYVTLVKTPGLPPGSLISPIRIRAP